MRHRFLNWRYQANALIENWLQAILKNRDSGLLVQSGFVVRNPSGSESSTMQVEPKLNAEPFTSRLG